MASSATIKCNLCVFRHSKSTRTLESCTGVHIATAPALRAAALHPDERCTLQTVIEERVEAGVQSQEPATAGAWALVCLSLSTLMSSLNTSVANVGLPELARFFGASFQQVQWVVLAYLLAISTLVVTAGRLSDVLGRRRVLLVGIYAFTGSSLVCGAAPTLGVLIAARALEGVGAAVMMAVTVALAGETVPRGRVGSAMGLLGTMSALGTTLGPSLGGVLISGMGWRGIFLINLPIGLLNAYLMHRYLPPTGPDRKKVPARIDTLGTVLLGLTLGAYALAVTTGGARFDRQNTVLLGAAGLGAWLFVRAEARTAWPLVDLGIFRNPTLSATFATSAMVSTVMMATLVVGPFYLSRALGLDAAAVGIAMSSGPLMAALAGVPSGRLVDRFGPARTAIAGLLAMLAGCLTLWMIPSAAGAPGYVGGIVVLATGYALFQAANNTAAMAETGAARRGVVSGMLNLSRNLGLVTGASAMATVFALASASSDPATASSEAVATGMHKTYLVAGSIVMAALLVAIANTRTGRARQSPVPCSDPPQFKAFAQQRTL
jgi:EmrB/QacA subfamily drug resistance transporter